MYGSAAQSPALVIALARGTDQRENTLQVQIAMIPEPDPIEELFASLADKPRPLDVDSLI